MDEKKLNKSPQLVGHELEKVLFLIKMQLALDHSKKLSDLPDGAIKDITKQDLLKASQRKTTEKDHINKLLEEDGIVDEQSILESIANLLYKGEEARTEEFEHLKSNRNLSDKVWERLQQMKDLEEDNNQDID